MACIYKGKKRGEKEMMDRWPAYMWQGQVLVAQHCQMHDSYNKSMTRIRGEKKEGKKR